ncbi:MAG: hypothetical protein RLY87_394 [Chloroflexota bacterium]|jgi:ABC-type uncharacterized transport system permease subunit
MHQVIIETRIFHALCTVFHMMRAMLCTIVVEKREMRHFYPVILQRLSHGYRVVMHWQKGYGERVFWHTTLSNHSEHMFLFYGAT